jgi:RimJ/RimL family protein N-acetyltransferase
MLKQPLLDDGLVGIRRFQSDDIPLLFNAVRESINELCAAMTWCRPDYALEDANRFVARCDSDWERGEQYNFAIVDAGSGTLLGSAGLNRVDRAHNFANLGYWVRCTQTRRGVATAATRLTARFGLKQLGFYRLEILVPSNNAASQRVAQKAGARHEGVLRNRLVLSGGLQDAILFSLVPGDLTPPSKPSSAVSAK